MRNGIGWCSVLRQTLVFQERPPHVVLLEPRDEYHPEGWDSDRPLRELIPQLDWRWLGYGYYGMI